MGPLFRGSTQSIFKDKQLLNKLSLNKPLCERVNSSFLCGSAMTLLRTLPPSLPPGTQQPMHQTAGDVRNWKNTQREGESRFLVTGRKTFYTAPQHFGVFLSGRWPSRDFTGVSSTRRLHSPLSFRIYYTHLLSAATICTVIEPPRREV